VFNKSVEFMMRKESATSHPVLTLSSPQIALLFVYSLIVQHPLKVRAKLRFDGGTHIVDLTWAPSKLTKPWVHLWLWYVDKQHFPDLIEPHFRVFWSKRNFHNKTLKFGIAGACSQSVKRGGVMHNQPV
jgi:hypothetical protein